jgi:hypothetical protein
MIVYDRPGNKPGGDLPPGRSALHTPTRPNQADADGSNRPEPDESWRDGFLAGIHLRLNPDLTKEQFFVIRDHVQRERLARERAEQNYYRAMNDAWMKERMREGVE